MPRLFGFPLVIVGIVGGVASAAAIAVWWLFFSRAPWLERAGVPILMAAAFFALRFVVDVSVSRGMMGNMLLLYAIPPLGLALVAWAAVAQNFRSGARGAALVAAIVLACLPWTLRPIGGHQGHRCRAPLALDADA